MRFLPIESETISMKGVATASKPACSNMIRKAKFKKFSKR